MQWTITIEGQSKTDMVPKLNYIVEQLIKQGFTVDHACVTSGARVCYSYAPPPHK